MAIDNLVLLHGPTFIKGVAGANIAITSLQFDFDADTASESVGLLLQAAFTGDVTLPAVNFGAPIGNALRCVGIVDGGGQTLIDAVTGDGVLMQLDQGAQAIEFRRAIDGSMTTLAAQTGIEATLMVSY